MFGLYLAKALTAIEAVAYTIIAWHCVLDDHGSHMRDEVADRMQLAS